MTKNDGVCKKAIVLSPKDNVAVVLEDGASGDTYELNGAIEGNIQVCDHIIFGHKFSLANIPVGARIIKYGHAIGEATAAIQKGQHVHVHNVSGLRADGTGAHNA